MTVYNTGTSADSGSGTAASQAVTVPAGVLGGDVVLIVGSAFNGALASTLSASSNGTAPTLLDQAQTAINNGIYQNGGLWYFVAAGTLGSASSDVGKTITLTSSSGSVFWSAALAAWTPTSSDTAPIDVHAVHTSVGTGTSETDPSLTTGVSGDWAIQCAAVATSASTLNIPSGTTQRVKDIPGHGIAAAIVDGNGSAGAAGASIGGGTWSSGTGNVWYVSWTVGLKPSSGAPPAVQAPAPPRIPHPLWWQLLEVAWQRADWQAQGTASLQQQHWRLMDGASGRPGTGSTGTQPPASATANGASITNGLSFYVTQGGLWFEGFWYYCCASGQSTSPAKFALWTTVNATGSGSVVPGSVVTSGTLTAGQWNFVPLPQPVQLGLWGVYVAAVGVPAGAGYPDTAGQFGPGQPYSAGIASGPLTAFSDLGGGNPSPGTFGQSPTAAAGSDPAVNLPGAANAGHDLLWLDVQVTNVAPAGYNGSYRLWPNMADADFATTGDASVNYVVGTEVILAQPSVVNAVWYYVPGAPAQLATSADIWRVRDGVRVAVNGAPNWRTASGTAGGGAAGWVRCEMPGVTLPPGDYYVTVYNGNGSPNSWSSKRLGYWQAYSQAPDGTYLHSPPGAGGIANGPLTAPTTPLASTITDYNNTSLSEPGQSVFATGPPNQFPDRYVGTPVALFQNYWVDVELTPAATWQPSQPLLPPRIPHQRFLELLDVAAYRQQRNTTTASAGGTVIQGTASLAGAGSVSAVVTQGAPASPAGAGSASAVVTQGAIASPAGAGTVSAPSAQQAGASPAGAGSLSALVTQVAIAALAGAGVVNASAGGNQQGTASLAGAGTLTAAGMVIIPGVASIAGAGSLTAAVRLAATASPAGAGSVTALTVQRGGAALVGAGAVTASGTAQGPFTVGRLTASTQSGVNAASTYAPTGAAGTSSGLNTTTTSP